MFAMELMAYFGIDCSRLSKNEKLLFSSYLFVNLNHELNEIFQAGYKNYFRLIKADFVMEDVMVEANFLHHIIKDILSTGEYSLEGIAYYIRIPKDVLYDLVTGFNINPSLMLYRKIIELHSTVRRDLYHTLIKKIMLDQI